MERKIHCIVVNGSRRPIELPCTLTKFIRSCGLETTQVVVEHNGEIVPRSAMDSIRIQDGDRLEVIIPVAGG